MRNLIIISLSVLISVTITSLFFIKKINQRVSDIENHTPKIIAVDTRELYKEFVLAIQSSIEDKMESKDPQKDEELIEQKIAEHEKAVDLFNQEIVRIAAKNNLIIIDKNSIISGAPDQTDKAKKLLKQLMQEGSYE